MWTYLLTSPANKKNKRQNKNGYIYSPNFENGFSTQKQVDAKTDAHKCYCYVKEE